MEDCSSSKLPTKPSSLKARSQAHSAIARSLNPSCAGAARLDHQRPSNTPADHHVHQFCASNSDDHRQHGVSANSTTLASSALESFMSLSGCTCSSSTTSIIADVQVPAHRRRHTSMQSQAVIRSKQNASKSASQKQVVPKKGAFIASFSKANSRVSDVSLNTKEEAPMLIPPKPASSKTGHKLEGRNSEEAAPIGFELGSGGPCGAKRLIMPSFRPVVKFTCDPSMAFFESMVEMVAAGFLDGCNELDLEGMFACYLVLNLPSHRRHIEAAFERLLTKLYGAHELSRIDMKSMTKHD